MWLIFVCHCHRFWSCMLFSIQPIQTLLIGNNMGGLSCPSRSSHFLTRSCILLSVALHVPSFGGTSRRHVALYPSIVLLIFSVTFICPVNQRDLMGAKYLRTSSTLIGKFALINLFLLFTEQNFYDLFHMQSSIQFVCLYPHPHAPQTSYDDFSTIGSFNVPHIYLLGSN